MNIEITNIVVVSCGGTDDVLIDTTLPMGTWPFTGNAHVKLQVACGQGEQYVKDNFPDVPYRVVRARG
jgi:hypothetical protein